MKKNIINVFIGMLLFISGLILYKSNDSATASAFLKYSALFLLFYGTLVILTKSVKIILFLTSKYKKLIVFEEKNKRIIPDCIKKVLEYRLKGDKEIEFEIPNYWPFQVINYNNSTGEDLNNPYFILKEIDYHIKRYFYPVIHYTQIIPVATDNNYKFLFVAEGMDNLILIDLDSADNKPVILKNKIDHYLNLNNLELRNDKFYYNGLKKIEDILDESHYFFDIPDCIFESKDYFEIYTKSFNLLDKKFNFSFSSVEETEEEYSVFLNIEDKSKNIKLRRFSDYIDSDEFIKSLNEILAELNYNQKKYYLLSYNICDFGIVLADEKTFQILSDNSLLLVNEEQVKLNSEELNTIKKYNDLITEINNIEFHLRVTKGNNELKKGILYNYYYQTNYEFDDNGIAELRKKLNVNLKKTDTGYDIYFTI
ncbi:MULTISPECIES: hypothetical protein [Flavobacterium]|uniref:hypothetical protein n=1 Tax=Flavobacterium TaxID=237 RepID=UPI001183BE71|nr:MULTISPECIES: hypothetical protein [Flavobacterium]MCR4033573.1 hypothetical protein [Flavobacterium panacis]